LDRSLTAQPEPDAAAVVAGVAPAVDGGAGDGEGDVVTTSAAPPQAAVTTATRTSAGAMKEERLTVRSTLRDEPAVVGRYG
jgi:hypothetical protein